MDEIAPESALWYWAPVAVVLNGISLVIDVLDVARFLREEREPRLVLKRN